MVQEYIKKGIKLSPAEISELESVYRLTNPNMPDNHILHNHIEKTDPLFHLFKLDGKVVAFQAYSVFNKRTPFYRKAIPVIYLNLSYKDASADRYVKNFAKQSNLAFLKRTFGRFWFLKRFCMVFQTYNPKLAERISPHFSKAYPDPVRPTPARVHEFAQEFFNRELCLPGTVINPKLVKEENYTSLSPITDEWESMYKSRNPFRNDFFFQNEIIVQQEVKFFLTGKAIFFIGYYSFRSMLKKRFFGKDS